MQPALAEDLAMNETFSLSAGGYHVLRADTTLSLVSRNAGAGAAIRPADTLGLDLENTVLKVNGRYRFSPSSQVVVSWYGAGCSRIWKWAWNTGYGKDLVPASDWRPTTSA